MQVQFHGKTQYVLVLKVMSILPQDAKPVIVSAVLHSLKATW
jgi:hypothetical protein